MSMDSPRKGLLDAVEAATSAARGPDPAQLRGRLRRRRRRRSVAGVAVLVAVAVPMIQDRGVPSVRVAPAPVPLTRGSDGSAVPLARGPVVPGMRPVSFHGLTIDVPKDWPYNALHCGEPLRNTVIVAPFIELCRLGSPPKGLSVVELTPLSQVSGYDPDRRQASQPRTTLRAADGRLRIILRDQALDARLVITSPDAGLAQRIAGRLRRTPTDFAGCTDRPGRLDAPQLGTPQRTGADRLLVPGKPVAAGVCRYEAGWLVRSARITGAQATALARTLNRLPHGTSRVAPGTFSTSMCAEWAGQAVLITSCTRTVNR